MDTTPQTAVTWMVDGVAVDTSPARISTDGATLSFSPLATSDTGSYTCTLTVTTSQTHVTVQGAIQSAVQSLNIEGIQIVQSVLQNISSVQCTPVYEWFVWFTCMTSQKGLPEVGINNYIMTKELI